MSKIEIGAKCLWNGKTVRVTGKYKDGDILIKRFDGNGWPHNDEILDRLSEGSLSPEGNWAVSPSNLTVIEPPSTKDKRDLAKEKFSIGSQVICNDNYIKDKIGQVVGYCKDDYKCFILVESSAITDGSSNANSLDMLPGFLPFRSDKARWFKPSELKLHYNNQEERVTYLKKAESLAYKIQVAEQAMGKKFEPEISFAKYEHEEINSAIKYATLGPDIFGQYQKVIVGHQHSPSQINLSEELVNGFSDIKKVEISIVPQPRLLI